MSTPAEEVPDPGRTGHHRVHPDPPSWWAARGRPPHHEGRCPGGDREHPRQGDRHDDQRQPRRPPTSATDPGATSNRRGWAPDPLRPTRGAITPTRSATGGSPVTSNVPNRTSSGMAGPATLGGSAGGAVRRNPPRRRGRVVAGGGVPHLAAWRARCRGEGAVERVLCHGPPRSVTHSPRQRGGAAHPLAIAPHRTGTGNRPWDTRTTAARPVVPVQASRQTRGGGRSGTGDPERPPAARHRGGAGPVGRPGPVSTTSGGRPPGRARPPRCRRRRRRWWRASPGGTSRTARRPCPRTGDPVRGVEPHALDPESAARLWVVSGEAPGVRAA